MSNQKITYMLVGALAFYVLYKVVQTDREKPLQSDINPAAIEPDSIARALSKLSNGGVKVNDTPKETIEANKG